MATSFSVTGEGVPVPERLRSNVETGQRVVLGMRPDDLTPRGHGIAENGHTASMELSVDLAELLGTETILYTQIAGKEVLGKMFDPREVAQGERMTFNIALEKLHLFDAGSEKSVRLN